MKIPLRDVVWKGTRLGDLSPEEFLVVVGDLLAENHALKTEGVHTRRVMNAAQMVVAVWENEPVNLDAEMRKFQLILDRKDTV
jgi:hypothetical protein